MNILIQELERDVGARLLSFPLPIKLQMLQFALTKKPQKGIAFEVLVKFHLKHLYYKGHQLQIDYISGGSGSRGYDGTILVGDKTIHIEMKTKNAFEAAGHTLPLSDDGRWLMSSDTVYYPYVKDIYRDAIRKRWGHAIPSFLKGNTSNDLWRKERASFPDVHLGKEGDVLPKNIVSMYYRSMGCDYIQIEDYGLYHTGVDPLELGVPLFECTSWIRIRCKQHSGKGEAPSDVQASINYAIRSTNLSPCCLLTRLPPSLYME